MLKKSKSSVLSLIPVVTAQEMARIERLAIESGCSEESFVAEAGRKVGSAALSWIEEKKLPKNVILLVGKGNNGGDAYAAGIFLLEEGVQVSAHVLYPSEKSSRLNQIFRDRFLKKKGRIGSVDYDEAGLIIDGFLGTGFKGVVEPKMAEEIKRANQSGKPILSIDIPSGLDGTTGEVRGGAIQASQTITLEMPKSGFFLREGWNRVGILRIEEFGLPKEFKDSVEPWAAVPDLTKFSLPLILRTRHKYQAGYVVGLGGSEIFRGAPKLAGLAALRSGAGIVRIFHKQEIGESPLELIFEKWLRKNWEKELARAGALFIGPGLGQGKEAEKFLKAELKKIKLPIVIDAEALQPDIEYPKQSILTPHRGEALRLLGLKKDTLEEDLLARCQKWASRNELILILKGAPTYIFSSKNPPVIIPRGDPGMATAGSGDVLTGILASLLAQKKEAFEAAILGVALHALAGEAAAKDKTSYGLIASDLIEYLPKAFQEF